MKLLITDKNRRFVVKDKDIHTNYGMIKIDKIKIAKVGDVVNTNKNYTMTVLDAEFIDLYSKIKRGAQIIPLKDIGAIIAETGIGKDTTIIEAGAGSGALGCFLANICKHVYSYEIRQDFYEIVKQNIENLGIKNMTLYNKDACDGFKEKGVDIIILDLANPWDLIKVSDDSLKAGGFLVSYSPTIIQSSDFLKNLGEKFIHIKTIEIIEREWEISNRKIRPKSQSIGHSGFLTFVRKT